MNDTPGRPSEDEGAMGDSFVSYADDDRGRASYEESMYESTHGEEDEDEENEGEDEEDEVEGETGDYDDDVTASMELDGQQKDVQDELRANLNRLAQVMSSPTAKQKR